MDRKPLHLLLRRLQQHAALPEADCRAVLGLSCHRRTLEASAYIVREGDPPLHCAVLVTGFAYRQKLTGDGARQIVALHLPGDALDFQNLFLDVADHNVQALTRCEVAFIPRAELRELARSRAAIAHAILLTTLIEASIFREWVLNVGRRNSRSRLAHLLCEIGVRFEGSEPGDGFSYELPMTQEQIADAVGLTPVHVNRTLQALEAEGLIARTRRHLTIPHWDRLREAGDFNRRYLHCELQAA